MTEEEQRDIAATEILSAMQSCVERGVESEVLETVALSAALTAFVSAHGEEATAAIIESLPEKIRAGAFSGEANPGRA
jgi:hypothetical protein